MVASSPSARTADVARGPLATRLRAETRADHAALERDLDLLAVPFDPETYRRRLGQFLGYYRPAEAALLDPNGPAAALPDLAERRKVPWLRTDLRALGDPDPDALPLCRALPDLSTPARAFGGLYVMEGATLGGRLIARHLAEVGVEPESGGRFFSAYGARGPAMWGRFLQALENGPASADPDATVAAAGETFRALRRWFASGDEPVAATPPALPDSSATRRPR